MTSPQIEQYEELPLTDDVQERPSGSPVPSLNYALDATQDYRTDCTCVIGRGIHSNIDTCTVAIIIIAAMVFIVVALAMIIHLVSR